MAESCIHDEETLNGELGKTSYSFRAVFSVHSPRREGSHRASASSSCSSGAGPATHDSPPSGSLRRELSYARCTATARSPDHRSSQAARALLRSGRRLQRQQRRAGSGGRVRARGQITVGTKPRSSPETSSCKQRAPRRSHPPVAH